jgi:hypothetical protein
VVYFVLATLDELMRWTRNIVASRIGRFVAFFSRMMSILAATSVWFEE